MSAPPSQPRIIINNGERVISAVEGNPLLFAAMAEKIFIPSACGGRASCGQCRIRVSSGAPDHIPEERAILGAEEMARGVHLACQLMVREETRIELPPGYLQARQYSCTVARIRDLAPGMREVELELREPSRMRFLAGQYVQFLRPGTENDPRPLYRAYSMASPPSIASRLLLLFARVPEGECTSYVFERLRAGEGVTVNGPFGFFSLRESDRQILFVAGGSGIAPIRAILIDMAERQIDRPATFFFSAHSAEDLVYAEDMRALERRLPGFNFVPVLSRPASTDHWTGEKGGVPAALARLLPALRNHEAYLCGGPGLIEASVRALKGKGLSEDRISFDKFS
jgi:Na+-transporting NADH:ubiquinone oxidoreductase subunit F